MNRDKALETIKEKTIMAAVKLLTDITPQLMILTMSKPKEVKDETEVKAD